MTLFLAASTRTDVSETPRCASTDDVRNGQDAPCATRGVATREATGCDHPVVPSAALERRRGGARMSRRAEIAIEEAATSREQQRIGQQLHDDLGGVLTGLNACLSVMLERAARAGATPDPLLQDAASLGKIAFDTVRQVAQQLRPPLLDYLGIWDAIEWHLNMLARRSSISCELVVTPGIRSIELGQARELVIFRVACEALTNIERHARASRAVLSVTEKAGQVLLSVVDDGVGFVAADLGSLGLSGMQERAGQFGGNLTINALREGGTQLLLRLPIGCRDGT